MVKIRLRRMGAKKAPFYRIVVADSRYPRDGRFIEEIGTYNPLTNPAELKVDADRAQAWIKTGAQPTETVKALLKKAGAIRWEALATSRNCSLILPKTWWNTLSRCLSPSTRATRRPSWSSGSPRRTWAR